MLNLVSERTIEQRMLGTLAHKQALSDSVLDQRGDPGAIKLAGGRENFMQRLETLLPLETSFTDVRARGRQESAKAPPRAPLPAAKLLPGRDTPTDQPREFCHSAAELLNGALISCEERFPSHGEASVLLLVVEKDAELWRERLRPLEQRFFTESRADESPPAVRLEVVDRSTAELLRRLAEAGVVNPSLRASRTLYPAPADNTAPLSPQEQNRARLARDLHARKIKTARILCGEEMVEEARAAASAAILELGRAIAIEHRLPEPTNALGAVAPPVDAFWPGGANVLLTLRTFLADEHAPVAPTIAALGHPVETGAHQARDFFAGIKAKLATIGS